MTASHFLYLILLGAIWGGSFLFTRIGIADLGTIWLVMLRVFLGASFLLLAALALRRSLALREHWRHWVFLGAMNTAVPFLLFAYGAHELSASLLSIINSTAPMWGVATMSPQRALSQPASSGHHDPCLASVSANQVSGSR